MEALVESNIPGLKLLFRGKVRDVYDLGDKLLIVASDRLSAFDWVLPTPIPQKGVILNKMSNWWFDRVGDVVEHHLLDIDVADVVRDADLARSLAPRTVVVKKTEPLKIEAVVRGYLAGSGWRDYQRTGEVCGHALPDGLVESQQLPKPIFTPATKAERGDHDENIDFDRAVEIVGQELAETVRQKAIEIYQFAADYARERGIILADTKFEFGLVDGELVLIDEILTPDSSRYWDVDVYEPGRSQPSFDKQYVRDYLAATSWDKESPPPNLPDEIVEQTRARYLEALRRVTGQTL